MPIEAPFFIKLNVMEDSGLIFYGRNGVAFSQSEIQLIVENVKRILTTRYGERVNEPEFGSNVKSFLFMPQVSIDDLIAEIVNSVERQEPRVIVNSCTLRSADLEDVVKIDLNLTVKTSSGDKDLNTEVSI